MIEVRNVRRVFDTRRQESRVALDGVDLSIRRGELFGVLGPNGAGKTTLIRILSTLLLPTSGSVTVGGVDVLRHPTTVRGRIGVVFGGDGGLYDRLTAIDNLRFAAQLQGLGRSVARRQIDALAEKVGLADRMKDRVETFSRGMKQRLHIARALLHEPDVLFLDEPSSGLDPVAARMLRELVKQVSARGTTVLLTTHYMFEADELCDRLAVLHGGRVAFSGTPEGLKESTSVGPVFHLRTAQDISHRVEALPSQLAPISTRMEQRDGRVEWTLAYAARAEVEREVLSGLLQVPESAIMVRAGSLEDAYIELIERQDPCPGAS